MTFLQAIILGVVQGITEFLPVSSSAHLVLVPYLFEWQLSEEIIFPFDILVQQGTLLAVILYFRKDLILIIASVFRCIRNRKPFAEQDSRLGWLIIVATIPAGILGMIFKDTVENAFSNPLATAFFLVVTGIIMVIAESVGKMEHNISDTSIPDALLIGLGQAFAIFPGISRSGATISTGMLRKLNRSDAARFSFLMSIPVMLAAGLIGVLDLFANPNISRSVLLIVVGTTISAIVGYFSIHYLLRFLKQSKLTSFAIYCFSIATITFITYAIR